MTCSNLFTNTSKIKKVDHKRSTNQSVYELFTYFKLTLEYSYNSYYKNIRFITTCQQRVGFCREFLYADSLLAKA